LRISDRCGELGLVERRASDVDAARAVRPSTYFFGALGGLLFGYDLGIIAGALLFLGPHFHLGSFSTGEVTSSLLVGAMVGALVCGPVTDRIGRRRVMLAAATLFGACAIGDALAPTLFWLLFFRAFMGLAIGAISVTVPVYLAEIAPARARGSLAGLNQLMISAGILVAYLVSLALKDGGHWRLMIGLAAVPAALLLAGTWFQPESPRWLIRKGREEEARAVLSASRTPEELDAEVAEIRRINDAQSSIRLGDLLADPRLRRLLLIGGGLALLQQICGVNTIIYYAPTILTNIGYGKSAAIIANAGLGGLTVAVTIIMLLVVVDRIGRRTPLILGAIGMAAAMALLAILFFSTGLNNGGSTGWLTIFALALFKTSFSLSWGGLVWIMLGEIFPLRARGPAMGVATFANWTGNFLVALLFPTLLGTGTGTVFVLFGALCLVACAFAYTCIPETKGASLEQLEQDLGAARTGQAGSPRAAAAESG
jgi:sugar porter (SP) family MFS transporter